MTHIKCAMLRILIIACKIVKFDNLITIKERAIGYKRNKKKNGKA